MSFAIAVAENFLLIVAVPWLVSDAARDLVTHIDNRGMVSIPFCRSLAIACGGLLAIATSVIAGIEGRLSVAELWDISGFWHEGRFLTILEVYLQEVWSGLQGAISAKRLLFVELLLALATTLVFINFAIAIMGWRGFGALRGLIAHLIISTSFWLILTIGVLAAIWVLHWLNFWIFLVFLIVFELRRREEATTKLSF